MKQWGGDDDGWSEINEAAKLVRRSQNEPTCDWVEFDPGSFCIICPAGTDFAHG